MSGNELSDKQQEQLSELFLNLLKGFLAYKEKFPDLEKLRQSIPDLDAKLKQFGDLNLQNDKTSQLEQTNQLINAIALNQEILQVIQKEIAEVTRLRDIEKESPTEKKSETPKGKSLAELYEARLAELAQLDLAARQQEAAFKARLEKLSKDLDKARSDRDDKYEEVVKAEEKYEESKVELEQSYQALNTSEIAKAELVQQREDNVTSFDQYAKNNEKDIQKKIAAQLTPEAIGNIAATVAKSETVDVDAGKVQKALEEKSGEINSAKFTHMRARARFVAEGLNVDSRFFQESRATFAEKMEAERKEKRNSELDDSIDSVFQGAAGPLTFNQFNATRDGLETSIAAELVQALGKDVSPTVAKEASDKYFASGMTVSLTDDLLKKASENAVSVQQMANADSEVRQAATQVKAAESTLTVRATELNTAVTNLASEQDNVLAKETAQLQLQVDRSRSSIAAVSPEADRVDTSKHSSDEVAKKIKSIQPNPEAELKKQAEQAKAKKAAAEAEAAEEKSRKKQEETAKEEQEKRTREDNKKGPSPSPNK